MEAKQLCLVTGVWDGHKNLASGSTQHINQEQTSTWEAVNGGIEELGALSLISKLTFPKLGGLYMEMR